MGNTYQFFPPNTPPPKPSTPNNPKETHTPCSAKKFGCLLNLNNPEVLNPCLYSSRRFRSLG